MYLFVLMCIIIINDILFSGKKTKLIRTETVLFVRSIKTIIL